jgi:hypothetical protein
MTENRFEAWLGRPEFESDEQKWLVGLASHPDDERLDVPSWLFNRVLAIGIAYQLSYIQVIAAAAGSGASPDDDLPVEFDSVQSVALIEELEFVRLRINDPAVDAVLDRLLLLAARCSRSPSETLRFMPIL